MKRLAGIALFLAVALAPLLGQELRTAAESSQYTKTTLYAEVMDFVSRLQQRSPRVKVASFCTSAEGRLVPLVVMSREGMASWRELRAAGKPAILVMANIHAGEIEGKEASLMMMRDIADGKYPGLLDAQTVLWLPIYNADGNDRLGRNRRDHGPDLAGVRYNGQNLDLNRDYLKLEAPETQALVQLFNEWDPLLVLDMHTTNGSYHRHPVTCTPQINPNADPALSDYMWTRLFPAVFAVLKKETGIEAIPYGNFLNDEFPERGWENDSPDARYGSNYVGLRNRFALLDENYSYADYKTRVQGAYGLLHAVLAYTAGHGGEMLALARAADRATAVTFAARPFTLEFKMERLFDFTIRSFEFEKVTVKPEERDKFPPWVSDFYMKPTERPRDYRLPYLAKAVPTRDRPLPSAGYILPPTQAEAAALLRRHGLRVERTRQPFRAAAENFRIGSVELAKTIYQGHVAVTLTGAYETAESDFPAGSFFVPMAQPLARLIPVLLEPESIDSLSAWGLFDRVLVQQWSNRPGTYPVWRLAFPPPVPTLSE
jgi:hypothetical protein